ncbi:SSI family serine proteinase inhibitor [Streptomyces sp. HMX87]|uniref:SSI family serine proteinase inhibitor n=1 Tax=Streptomyces sp. HMX87 TaxID=3390849 RepID=UPI003A893F51
MTHTTTAKAARGGLLAAVAVLVACAGLAQAAAPVQAAAPARFADDWLFLTVARGETPADVTHGALLLCDPPQGHARAAGACADLAAADGDPAAIPLRDTPCPMIYAPVTAQARGQWKGRPVEYTRTFPNACVMAARTGAVFALDEDR